MSANGNYIVGYTGEYGERIGWVISLPEPGSLVAAFPLIGCALLRRNRVAR
jgi:hypothetical protein